MKTTTPTQDMMNDRKWYVIDAEGQTLGRLATKIADVLRGKHKPTFTPHMDLGDHVVVVNADKIRVSGSSKADQKFYYSHSGVPGHLKMRSLAEMMEKRPLKVLENAVHGMLPKNKLRAKFIKKLHLYEGTEHNHEAQSPQPLSV